ncbi:MAG: hypothetical protein PVJ76_05350 [Gemmatimonadota bacterium]|jgi:hypothetical protein
MMEEHQPRPEFVDYLEWQLRTSLARENRFSDPIPTKTGGRMKLTALVLLSALLGAGGVVANDELQEARAQEVLVARVQADIELASLELQILKQQLQETEDRYSAGVVGEEALLAARIETEEAEMRLESLFLDLDEIQASGKAPNTELSAPLVGGRDFVTSRLALQESLAEERSQLARFRLSRVEELLDVGAVSTEEQLQALLAAEEAELEVKRLIERLDMRKRIVEGDMEEGDAERRLEVFETEKRLDLLQNVGYGNAQYRFQRVADLVEAGVAQESELQRARLQLLELETEMEFLERKLRALRGGEV